MTSVLGASPPPAAPPPPLLCSPWFSSVSPSTAATIGGAWFQIGANPGAFIRSVFCTLGLDLLQIFELLPPRPRRRRRRAILHARLPVELWPANRAAPPVCDPRRIFAAVAVAGLTRLVYSLFTSPAIEMDENVRGQPIDPHLPCAREDFCTAVFLRLDERHLPRE